MPYWGEFTIYDNTATSATHALSCPPHVAGDILLLIANADGTYAPATPTSSGGGTWNSRQTAANVGGQSFRLCDITCTSDAETCATTLTVTETLAGIIVRIRGNGGTLAYDTSAARTTDDSTEPFDGVAITPGVANTLLFQCLTSDGAIGPMIAPPIRNIAACDTAANSVGIAAMYPLTTSAVALKNWYSGVAVDNTMAVAVTYKDDGSEDSVNAYLDPLSSAVYHYNGGSAAKNGVTWDAATPHPILAFTQRDLTQVWSFNGTSTYTDETVDAADVGTNDVTITNAVGAIWYFGYDLPFENMVAVVYTAAVGGTVVWEYFDGSTWVTLTVANGTLPSGNQVVLSWTLPSDMAETSVNGVSKYYVRMRVTVVFTTGVPVLSQIGAGGSMTGFVAAAAAADAHFLPYANATSVVAPQHTGLYYTGSSYVTTSPHDMDAGVLVIHHRAALARDYAVDPCAPRQEFPITKLRRRSGVVVVLVDASGNYEGYTIHGKGSVSNSVNDFNTAVIAINNGAEPLLIKGTLDKSAVNSVYLLAQAEYGPVTFYAANWINVELVVMAGGGVGGANPITYDDFVDCINKSLMYSNVMNRAGDTTRVYAPIQLGGGDHCNVLMDGKTFVWPNTYDGVKYHDYNGADDVLNLTIYGQTSDDNFVLTNCIFKAGQPQKFEFHSSHNSDATVNLSGSTIQGFNVTLRSNVDQSNLIFKSCPSLALNGATLSDCTFYGTKVSAASPAEADNISTSSFTSSGTGHAITITGTAANFSFAGNTFTGYAASDGSTGNEAIYVNIASGTMTINISGGSTPSVRTAGATVTVSNSVTVTISAQVSLIGTEVRIYDFDGGGGTDYGTELAGTESHTTTDDYAYSGAVSNTILIQIMKTGYEEFTQQYTMPSTSATLDITLVPELNS